MTVTSLNMPEKRPKVAELVDRLHEVIVTYDGEIGFAEALGALKLLEVRMINTQLENLEEE